MGPAVLVTAGPCCVVHHAPVSAEPLRLHWDEEAGAGYLALTTIGDGAAVSQRLVANPVRDLGPVVLDFDAAGHLLGIEFLDRRSVPPGLPQLQSVPADAGVERARQGSNLRPSA